MLTAFRDYMSINFARIRKAFLIIYGCFLIGQIIVISRTVTDADVVAFIGLVWSIGLAITVLAFVLIVALIDTYSRCKTLARSHGTSIATYVKSAEYQKHGKDKLRRTDPDLKWF